MLIGLNGRLQSGKDTTYEVIKHMAEEAGQPAPTRVSFAEPLKESAAQALGMSRDLMEHLKNHEEIFIEIPTMSVMQTSMDSSHKSEASHWKLNLRSYLQRYGTEAHRDIFGEDFWVDMALPLDTDHEGKLLVVTDMRFPNEVQRVKDLGGHTVKVVREVETAHNLHPSEQDVDHMIDYFLDNTGSMENLEEEIAAMLVTFGAVKLPERTLNC